MHVEEDGVEADQELELHRELRRRVLRCVMHAVAKLAREARGEELIEREVELRACIALARLAPVLLGASAQRATLAAQEDPPGPRIHPDCPIEEAERLMDEAEQRDRARWQGLLPSTSAAESTTGSLNHHPIEQRRVS